MNDAEIGSLVSYLRREYRFVITPYGSERELTDDMVLGYLVAVMNVDPNVPSHFTSSQQLEIARKVLKAATV